MALPNKNISVAMVKAELGASTNDVGQLCIHPNVNKWSKWKPVRYGSVMPITEAQLQSTNYGLSVDRISTLNFEAEMLSDTTYNKPRGGLSEPYRLSDFNKYKHVTIPSYEVTYPNTIYSGGSTYQNAIALSEAGDFDAVNIAEFYSSIGVSYESMYLCLVITNSENNIIYVVTTEHPIGGGNILLPFSIYAPPSSSARATLTLVMSTNKLGSFSDRHIYPITLGNIPPNTFFYPFVNDGTIRQKTSVGMSSASAPQPPIASRWKIDNVTGWNSVVESYSQISVDVNITSMAEGSQVLNPSILRYSMLIMGDGYTRNLKDVTPSNIVIYNTGGINKGESVRVTMNLPITNSIRTSYDGSIFISYISGGTTTQIIGASRVSYID